GCTGLLDARPAPPSTRLPYTTLFRSPFPYAFFSTGINNRRVTSLQRCHGMDNGFNTFKSIIVYINIFHHFSSSRNHPNEVFHIPHFLDLLNLLQEIVKAKLIFSNFLLDFSCFLLIILLLSSFNQRHHFSHAQNSICHTRWIEHINSFHFLASTYKLNRLINYRFNGNCSSTTSITI